MRIIKKYPNRRLYDTHVSRYITLEEVKVLVLDHIPFKIVDAETEEDMTDYVLLQIISENESGKMPIFTTEMLQNIIRFYGNPMQKTLSEFLEKSFSAFQDAVKKSPMDTLTALAKKNMALWQSSVENFMNAAGSKQKKSGKNNNNKE